MDFELLHVVFNVSTVIAFICVFILFLIYQRVGGNVLLRSCSAMLLIMLTVILIGSAIYENDMSMRGRVYCKSQAVMLNYCHISVHGLIACMMFDAWSHVSNWWPRKQKLSPAGKLKRSFSPSYIFCSFILPLIPTIVLITFASVPPSSESPSDDLIVENTYYCYINIHTKNVYHPYLINLGWIILYSGVGIFCSVYLLIKTILTRQKSKKSGRTTHLTMLSIFRVAIATLIYILITLAAVLPLYLVTCPSSSELSKVVINNSTKSPYLNPNLCRDKSFAFGNKLSFWEYMRCPRWYRDFLPCIIGIGFFFMYGFGKHAKKAYVDFYRRYIKCKLGLN